MTDESKTTVESQEDTTTEAQAATADTQAGGSANEDVLTTTEIRKLRSEAKNLRDRAKAAEAKLAERDKTDLTEKERLEKDRDEHAEKAKALEADLRFTRTQLVAGKVGVRPEALEDVAKLLDWDLIDDPDDSKALEKAVRALVKEKPHLSAVASGADGGARGSGEIAPDMNQLIRRAAGASR